MALLIIEVISLLIWFNIFWKSIFDDGKSKYKTMFSIASGYVVFIISVRVIQRLIELQ